MIRRIIAGLLVGVLVANIVVDTARAAQSYDEDYFSQNNILYYDTRCLDSTASGGLMQLAGNDNTEKILNFFMRKGLTLAQAAGIVGNMMQESGLNPAIIQGGRTADDSYTPENGVGFGLVQWTFTGRQKPLVDHMKQMGVGITNLSGQLEFVWKELSGSYAHSLRAIKAASNPVDAAIAAHGPPSPGYEASADSPEKVRTVRGGNAQKVYNKYKDAPAMAGSTATPDMTPTAEGEGAAETVASKTADGSSSDACTNSFSGGDLAATVKAYAWPKFTAGRTDQQAAYTAAISKAKSENRYIGGANGNDCGGFVTTLIYDSGFDKSYNSNAKGGNTIAQEAWLQKNWQKLNDSDRQPGDVAINATHTYIYVGKIEGFGSVTASASYSDRSPMAGSESQSDPSFRWYRKKN